MLLHCDKAITLPPGTLLLLTDAQLTAREYALCVGEKRESGTICTTVKPVQFKAGELIWLCGDDLKALGRGVTVIEPEPEPEPEPELDPELDPEPEPERISKKIKQE